MSFIPFDLPGFKISRTYSLENKLIITACSVQVLGHCPACQTASSSVHSYYQRSPKDLPSSGKAIRLNLLVRRFRCNNPQCSKKVFAERLPNVLAPNAQRTERLNATLQIFADNFSAEIAARVLKKVSMRVSLNTLLRLLKRAARVVIRPVKPLRIISVDDFAFKRGRSYGTLVLDLQTHRPVELLPDRTAATLAAWLRVRPLLELVSRDRSPEYARAFEKGHPRRCK